MKGKGKAKAPTTVIEIDTDDSDEGGLEALAHRHEDANDPIESDDDDDDDRRPSTSTAGPAKKASGSRARKSAAFTGVGDAPSSPDPIAISTARSSEHRNKNAAPSTATLRRTSQLADSQPGPSVQKLVATYESKQQAGNPPKTMVGSMRRRGVGAARL